MKLARKDSNKQESHKMLNNIIDFEYKYPCICIGVEVYGNKKDSAKD